MLAETVNQHEAARRLGCQWPRLGISADLRSEGAKPSVKSNPGVPAQSQRPVSDLEAEVSRLRKPASAKLDIEILRNATAYFEGVAVKYAWPSR